MLNDFSCSCPVYIACGYTDLRRGIDGLANLVKTQFQMDPFQRALFLFCGRRRDRLKGLYWEGDGFLLLYKRLESGSFSMASEHGGSAGFNAPAIPLADGGTEDRAAEGKQGSVRPERNIIPGSIENTGFLSRFVVSFIHGKQEEHCRKHPGNGDHFAGGIRFSAGTTD